LIEDDLIMKIKFEINVDEINEKSKND